MPVKKPQPADSSPLPADSTSSPADTAPPPADLTPLPASIPPEKNIGMVYYSMCTFDSKEERREAEVVELCV